MSGHSQLLADLREAELVLSTKMPRRALNSLELFGQSLQQV